MGTTVDDFVLLVKDRMATVYGDIQKARGVMAFVAMTQLVLRTVEEVSVAGQKMTGPEKKEAAIDILNDIIDIPFLPEWLEAKVIGLVIEAVIAGFNTLFSKLWIQKVVPPEPVVLP